MFLPKDLVWHRFVPQIGLKMCVSAFISAYMRGSIIVITGSITGMAC